MTRTHEIRWRPARSEFQAERQELLEQMYWRAVDRDERTKLTDLVARIERAGGKIHTA